MKLEKIQSLFPNREIVEKEMDVKSKNDSGIFITECNKKIFIKKMKNAHYANEHEKKARALSPFLHTLYIPKIIENNNEYLAIEFIPNAVSYKNSIINNSEIFIENIINITNDININCPDNIVQSIVCNPPTDYRVEDALKIFSNAQFKELSYESDIRSFFQEFDMKRISNSELVHGDFTLFNILHAENCKPIVIDWEYMYKGDRHMDYSSMYASLCLENFEYAEQYYNFLETIEHFDKEIFQYFFYIHVIRYAAENYKKKMDVYEQYISILELFRAKHSSSIRMQIGNLNKQIIKNFRKKCFNNDEISIIPFEDLYYNSRREAIFRCISKKDGKELFLKILDEPQYAKEEMVMSKYNDYFKNFSVPTAVFQEQEYLAYIPEYIGMKSLSDIKDSQPKLAILCIHDVIRDLAFVGHKLPIYTDRAEHKDSNKKTMMSCIHRAELEKEEWFAPLLQFVENFDESKIRKDQLINERIAFDTVYMDSKGDLIVVDWRNASLGDCNFDYAMSFIVLEFSNEIKDIFMQELKKEKFFDKEIFLWFCLEKLMWSVMACMGGKFSYAHKNEYIKRIKLFLEYFIDFFDITHSPSLNKQKNKKIKYIKNSYSFLSDLEGHDIVSKIKTTKISKKFKNLLNESCSFPYVQIHSGYLTFYSSKIIQTTYYKQVILYVKNNNEWKYRILYKSKSDGTWRSCPAYTYGHFFKGKGIHYTQETKLSFIFLEYLNKLEKNNIILESDYEYISLYLDETSLDEYSLEIDKWDDKGFLLDFQSHHPGEIFTKGNMPEDYIKSIDWNDSLYSDFFPDFTLPPIDFYDFSHSLLGNVLYEIFPAKLNNKNIYWVMAYTRNGETWIDRIYFKDNDISSYAGSKRIIDSGFLTSKPLEYISQCENLKEGIHYTQYDENYNNITPILHSIPIIDIFRRQRNII